MRLCFFLLMFLGVESSLFSCEEYIWMEGRDEGWRPKGQRGQGILTRKHLKEAMIPKDHPTPAECEPFTKSFSDPGIVASQSKDFNLQIADSAPLTLIWAAPYDPSVKFSRSERMPAREKIKKKKRRKRALTSSSLPTAGGLSSTEKMKISNIIHSE